MKQQAYYSNYSATTELSIAAYRRKAAFISTFRLLCIGVLAIGIYAFWAQYLLLPIIALGLGLFIWLVKIHAKTKDKLQFLKNLLHLLRDEEHLANGAWRTRPSGSAYQEKGHPFAADLNYFGAKGIYSYLNRSQSEWAGEILATWLKNPLYDKEEILAEQERFKNLAAKPDFMFEYLAEMALSPVDLSDKRALINWQNQILKLPNKFSDFSLAYILPAIAILGMLLLIFGTISGRVSLLFLIPSGIALGLRFKQHQVAFINMEPAGVIAKRFSSLLRLIEAADMHTQTTHNSVSQEELIRAKSIFQKLQRIHGNIDSRNNMFVGSVLNLLFLWDYHAYRSLSKWKKEYQSEFYTWVVRCIELEALISLGVHVFNHPDYRFARFDISEGMELVNGRHLLMDEHAVPNGIAIGNPIKMAIITGANMAGKSTFLRMIASHITLSLRGIPVPADILRLAPSVVFTSMTTSDSLADDESYFFNEIKRLTELVKLTKGQTPVFAVLDEILKGTNSIDKAKGSSAFVEKLLTLPVHGLIATHDLSLCELANKYPNELVNYRFEIEFDQSELVFAYRMEPGVCANMNASFLLAKHGLIDPPLIAASAE